MADGKDSIRSNVFKVVLHEPRSEPETKESVAAGQSFNRLDVSQTEMSRESRGSVTCVRIEKSRDALLSKNPGRLWSRPPPHPQGRHSGI
jgi:hypothetical protein